MYANQSGCYFFGIKAHAPIINGNDTRELKFIDNVTGSITVVNG